MFSRFFALVLEAFFKFLGKKVEEQQEERNITQNMLLYVDESQKKDKLRELDEEGSIDAALHLNRQLRNPRK